MKERPILFSGEMVRAILDGRKTQTRRVCSVTDLDDLREGRVAQGLGKFRVGDRLWVREGFGITDGQPVCLDGQTYDLDDRRIIYRADVSDAIPDRFWRPSIHMPRWASRITLEVVSVRVERLQDISIDDAIAEGVFQGFDPPDGHGFRSEARTLYREFWESINGKKHPWKSNPWVWVIEFKVVSQ